MSTEHQRIMKRFGLERIRVPAAVGDVVEKRIRGLWEANYCNSTLESLPATIKRYGFDCYTQGLLDATSPRVRARIEKLALEGIIPPMDCTP